jgi:HEPN domain-containing protein
VHDSYYGVSEQRKAGKHRLDDAQSLLNSSRWRGAMYLAGYSIECQLKTALMRVFSCRHLRDLEHELRARGILAPDATVFTHQLEVLLHLTNAMDRLRQNVENWRQFNVVNRWMPAWRYNSDLSNEDDANFFMDAVENISRWIENNI